MATTIDLVGMTVFTRAAALGGGDFNAVLDQLNISVIQDEYAFHKLTVTELDTLLNALEASCKLQHFPFTFGEVFNFEGLPELSAFVVSSSKLREAAQLMEWIPQLIHPCIEIDGSDFHSQAITRLGFHNPDGSHAQIPVFAEMIAAVVKRFSQLLIPNANVLTSVSFAHAPRLAPEEYQRYFGCEVKFEQATNTICYHPDLLDQPLPGNLPPVHEQAERSIRVKLLDNNLAGSLHGQIQTLLRNNLNLFSEGIEGVANALHMHPRKLQRALKAEGQSFTEVLAKTRHTVARQMLEKADIDIDSIGFKLGFEERRSFTSAFKKWQGLTPSAYRKQQK